MKTKTLFKLSLAYGLFGLFAGLFYHEASYWTHFTGTTVLSLVHPHALALGGGFFLLAALLMKSFSLGGSKSFRIFVITYNIGLVMTLGFLSLRGVTQLFALPVSTFWDHMIGGMAGIGHVILTVGLGFFFYALFRSCRDE